MLTKGLFACTGPDKVQIVKSRMTIKCFLFVVTLPTPVFTKTAGLSDKTGKFSFCPAENFSLSDKCPVISGKKR